MVSPSETRPARRGPSPVIAAVLSFFVPGLGQIYAGRVLRGLVLAIPQGAVVALLVVSYLDSPVRLGGLLYQYAFAVAVINVLMLLYRAFAVVDAYLAARAHGTVASRRAPSRGLAATGAIVLAILLAATVGLHGVAAVDSYVAYETQAPIFSDCGEVDVELPVRGCESGETSPSPGPIGSPTPTGPMVTGATPSPVPGSTPAASPDASPSLPPIIESDAYWAENGRLDLLLMGSDAGPGRIGTRPDAIHVASVDLATGRSSIVSLPRYLQYPPLPEDLAHLWPCGCFVGDEAGYLNEIYTYATAHPDDFPGGNNRGFRATQQVVETLLGISIDGIVVVDLNGFVDAVDAIGGIVMNVPEGVYDDRYNAENDVREIVEIEAGWQHMDGHTALQYVRTRHQDGDIQRLGRQQNFLHALRRQLTTCAVHILPRLPDLLGAVGRSVRTDVPLEEVPTLLDLLTRTKKPRRVEMHSDNGFMRDATQPGQLELYRQAMAAAFAPRPGEGSEEPEETPPDRIGDGC